MSRAPGLGSTRTHVQDQRRIVVSFDEATFQEVRDHAIANGISFAAAVRELVEFGLMEVEGADQ